VLGLDRHHPSDHLGEEERRCLLMHKIR